MLVTLPWQIEAPISQVPGLEVRPARRGGKAEQDRVLGSPLKSRLTESIKHLPIYRGEDVHDEAELAVSFESVDDADLDCAVLWLRASRREDPAPRRPRCCQRGRRRRTRSCHRISVFGAEHIFPEAVVGAADLASALCDLLAVDKQLVASVALNKDNVLVVLKENSVETS